MIFDQLEKNTPLTAGIVNTISKQMKGNTFHHHYHILYTLRDLIHKDYAHYTEIGTFNGGSLCLMLQHPKPLSILSVDPFHIDVSNIDIVLENINKFNKYNYHVELTKKFSTDNDLLSELKKKGFQTDILFIDGDHSFSAVVKDFLLWHEFVSPGGFLVFDDYHDKEYSPEVFHAVNAIVHTIQTYNLPFTILGSPNNFCTVYPSEFPYLNEFILQRKG